MNALDIDVLQQAHAWVQAGHQIHLMTVVKTWGSAPRQPGALLVIRADGRVRGSVSGGCIEDDLIRRAQENRLPSTPTTLIYGATDDEATRFDLPCGGTLELMVEPVLDTRWLDEVLSAIQQQQLIGRSLDRSTGQVSLRPALPHEELSCDAHTFFSVYGPRWRLLIVGANQTARMLCPLAQALDYQVTVCDPRHAFFSEWDVAGTQLVRTMPDDTVLEMEVDVRTAIVAVSHDRKLDDMALLEALVSPAFYVGALGSKANQKKRKERLALFDLSPAQIARLHGPIGLEIGSRTPAEIAIAIAAELILVRNGLEQVLVQTRADA